jgi:uncharacterized repeat protein (TIGR02543 family)
VGSLRRWIIRLTLVCLVVGLLPVSLVLTANPAAAAVACGQAENNITVNPSHGEVFYIDSGVSPQLDAAYVGYRITNNTGSTMSGFWVSLTSFSGGVVSLANANDRFQQLPDIPDKGSKTVYFLLKASAPTKVAQSHSVQVWNARPDLASASTRYTCAYAFTKVAETIKAAANKVTSIKIDDTDPDVGQLITMTVEGGTGTIGAGSPDVGRIVWFSPAALASWPTRSLRLESVTLKLCTDKNCSVSNFKQYDERLLITPSITPDSGTAGADDLVGKRYYQNTYKFRVTARTTGAVPLSPVAQISSGTQIKHSNQALTGSGNVTTINVDNSVSVSVAKAATAADCSSIEVVGGYATVRYRVKITNSTSPAVTVSVSQIIDSPPAGALLTAGSATIKVGSATAVALPDPSTVSGSSDLHFVGPWDVTTTAAVEIEYSLRIPVTDSPATLTNYAAGYIGSQIIGASGQTTVPGVAIATSGGAITSCSTTTRALDPEVATYDAFSVGETSATLAGVVDGNGASPTATFEIGTDSALATYTSISLGTVSGGDPVSLTSARTGLTSGVTYYFRLVATVTSGGTAVRFEGAIRQFTTLEVAGTPEAVTIGASSVGSTSATLNGSVDANRTSVTEIRFVYGTSSTLASGNTTTILYELNEDGGDTTTKETATGAHPVDVSKVIASLTTGTIYYFRLEAVYASGTATGVIKSFKTGTSSQTITFPPIGEQEFSSDTFALTGDAAATATSGLTVSYTSETPLVCSVSGTTITYLAAGSCAVTASQSGNSSYSEAPSVTRTFQITTSAPTATTTAATAVGASQATVNGSITWGGSATTVSFRYSTASDLSGATTVTGSPSTRSSNGSASATVTGLTAGTRYYFRIVASNASATVAGSILSFTTLGITTASPLTGGEVSVAYSTTLMATGGTGVYSSWSVTEGSLPAGLSLNSSTGVISGTPTAVGNTTFTIRVTDSAGAVTTKVLTLSVVALPTAATSAATSVTASQATLNGSITWGGAASTITFEYSTISTLAGATSVSATPSSRTDNGTASAALTGLSAGTTYYFRIAASNSAGSAQGSTLSFTTLGISTVSPLPSGEVNDAYELTFDAVGGTGPYSSWRLTTGSLPAGLSLDAATGVLSGTPTAAGTFSFTVEVSDSNGAKTTKVFTLEIEPEGAPLASTDTPESITKSSFVLKGRVNPRGNSGGGGRIHWSKSLEFADVDETSKAGTTDEVSVSGTDFSTLDVTVSADSATVYYFRAKGKANGFGAVYGAKRAVLTLPDKPESISISVSGTTATVSFAAVSKGAAINTVDISYDVTCTNTANASDVKTQTGTATSLTVTGLTAGASYSCVVAATSSFASGFTGVDPSYRHGGGKGSDSSAASANVPGVPTATTQAASSVSRTSFSPNGKVNARGNGGGAGRFEWSADRTFPEAATSRTTERAVSEPSTDLILNETASSLTPASIYFFRARATASGQSTVFGSARAVLTLPDAPTGRTANASGSTVTLTFTPVSSGTHVDIEYHATCTSATGTTRSATGAGSGLDDGDRSLQVNSLTLGATYSCRVKAKSLYGTSFNSVEFAAPGGVTYTRFSLQQFAEDTRRDGGGFGDETTFADFSTLAAKTDQAITFAQPADAMTTGGPVTLSATASSGLAVSYVSNSPSVCTVSGSTVTIVGPGTCSITASQPGDGTYEPASDVTRTFQISSGGGGGAPPPPSAPVVTYSVTYSSNGSTGGSAPVDPGAYAAGATVTVLGRGTLVRDGYAFVGWNTVSNGTGTMQTESSTFVMGTAAVVLFAQWRLVIPAAPDSAFYTPRSLTRTDVRWTAVQGPGLTYEVTVNGSVACVSVLTSCWVAKILGPSSSVSVATVTTQGARSVARKAEYSAVRPVPVLTVNFAESSPVLSSPQKREMRAVAAVIKREGFTELSIQGHTDAQGGTRNAQALSKARALATAEYFRALLPTVKFVALSGLGLKKPVASNATKAGQAQNRRSEILIR